MPTVSVLMAARDAESYLEEAIRSVVAQHLDDWELIVVDDASTDGTGDIADRWSARDPRVTVVHRAKSGGPYVAANEGLKRAGGHYVARLDADDVATPERLEWQLAFLRAWPGLRACGAYHRDLFPGRLSGVRRWAPLVPRALTWWLGVAGGPAHSTAFFERGAIEEIGGYREIPTAADRWMWCDMARRGWLGVLPVDVVYRRRHRRQLSATGGERQLRASLEAAKEHLTALCGTTWSLQTVEDLYLATHASPVSFTAGARGLTRWTRAWLRDPALSREGKLELLRFVSRSVLRRLRGRRAGGAGKKLTDLA